MGLVKVVILDPQERALPGVAVSLRAHEGGKSLGQQETDSEGVARFRVDSGVYKAEFPALPEGVKAPDYGTRFTLGEFTQAVEYVVRLRRSSL